MRFNYLITPLLLLPLCAFSDTQEITDTMLFSQTPVGKYTVVKTFSNEANTKKDIKVQSRTVDFPTQIIRMSSTLTDIKLNCDEVNDLIEKAVVEDITADKFTYNTYISCGYDPDTNFAIRFSINSYFDPLSDDAVDFLKTYLASHNGADLLGTKINIESAKGLIISLNIAAGVKKNPNSPPFIQYRQDRSNFYFASNYEMREKLVDDIYANFFSNDPEKILPFLNKWIFSYAGYIYKPVLRDSNYVELQPERIFLMENGEQIFVSGLKYYFAHICNKYENHRCLQQDS